MVGIAKFDAEDMRKNTKKTYGGIFNSTLSVITRDTKFIKAATIKDFSHFVNRNQVFIWKFFNFL